MLNELVVMIGLPGSGKSTYVTQWLAKEHQIVCCDDIRLALGCIFDQKLEPFVHAIAHTMCRAHMERHLPIVIDETNTRLGSLTKWSKLADEYNYEKVGIFMNIPIEKCKERRGCPKFFDESIIDRMNSQLELMELDEIKSFFNEFKEIKE